MNWQNLVKIEPKGLSRGAVLRFPAQYPYEDSVDFMVIDPLKEGKGLALLVATGYKAGLIAVILPEESSGEYSSYIDSNWLISNWNKWIYPDCNVEDVLVIDCYPEPKLES